MVMCLPPARSHRATRLPLDNSTGYLVLSARILVVKVDMTSGRSG